MIIVVWLKLCAIKTFKLFCLCDFFDIGLICVKTVSRRRYFSVPLLGRHLIHQELPISRNTTLPQSEWTRFLIGIEIYLVITTLIWICILELFYILIILWTILMNLFQEYFDSFNPQLKNRLAYYNFNTIFEFLGQFTIRYMYYFSKRCCQFWQHAFFWLGCAVPLKRLTTGKYEKVDSLSLHLV